MLGGFEHHHNKQCTSSLREIIQATALQQQAERNVVKLKTDALLLGDVRESKNTDTVALQRRAALLGAGPGQGPASCRQSTVPLSTSSPSQQTDVIITSTPRGTF